MPLTVPDGNQVISRDPGIAFASASNVMARRANTTAYAAGQLIGGSATVGFDGGGGTAINGFTFSGVSRFPSGAYQYNTGLSQTAVIRLDRARLYKSQATAAGTFELRVYRAKPTITIADAGTVAGGVPVGSGAATARLVARFAFDFTTAVVGSDGAELASTTVSGVPAFAGLPQDGTDLFAVLVATGAYTPTSGETFNVVLEGLAF